jgi:fumarylpyruvate hydrolase
VAIGKSGFRIPEAEALGHVFGYACGLDMTRRDLQSAAKEKQRPWDIGKDVEQSAVLGEIAPASEIGTSRSRPDRTAGERPGETVR